MGYRLVVVSADSYVRELVDACAPQGEYAVEVIKTGTQALREALQRRPDLVVLDLQIPDMSGLEWLKIMRQTAAGKSLPVIVMSAQKKDEEMTEAFSWGADDFVQKPCAPLEFTARIRAVLRRRFEREEQSGYEMLLGPIGLDPARHRCHVRGKTVELRPREFELLEILMRKAGRVLSRNYLLETVWGMSRFSDTRTVDVAVSRLRKALGRRDNTWVETVERYGYRFRNPDELIR